MRSFVIHIHFLGCLGLKVDAMGPYVAVTNEQMDMVSRGRYAL